MINVSYYLFMYREEFAAAWMNLGIVKASLKKYSEAEKCYYTAIKHRRKYPDCYYNLGNLVKHTYYSELYTLLDTLLPESVKIVFSLWL